MQALRVSALILVADSKAAVAFEILEPLLQNRRC